MEASQRQLPMDESAVRVLEDRLVIEALTIADERAARVVRERAEAGERPAETVAKAIEIGTRVLDREETAADVDFVRVEFERMEGEARERAAERDKALATWLQTELKSVPEDVRERVQKMLEETRKGQITDVLKQMGQQLGERTDRAIREIRESEAKEHAQNREKIAELTERLARAEERDEADVRVAEAEEAGTRKGFDFEDTVHAEIERIAAARGDAAHHVGAVSNEAGSKKGDTLVELGAANGAAKARVVFEAKDKRLSRNDAWQELDAELEGRDASFAVLVVSGESKLPAKTQELHEYMGNKMVVIFDKESPDPLGLELVYRYACARALMASEAELDVDAQGVGVLVERAAAALKRGKGVRDSLTKAAQGVESAREGFDSIVEDVDACLQEVESLIAPAVDNRGGRGG